MGRKIWFEISGAGSKNRGFERSGGKLSCLTIPNPVETCHGSKNREIRKIEGLKYRDSTVHPNNLDENG